MSQWSNTDIANSAPNFVTNATTGETGIEEYGTNVFGYKPSDVHGEKVGLGSPGWVRIVRGSGKITDVELVSGGTGYANTDTFTVQNGLEVFGDGTVETDEDGVITSIVYSSQQEDSQVVPEILWDTETGTGAELKIVTTGQIGRVRSETLVAMRNIQ